jgi:hypothetical protein
VRRVIRATTTCGMLLACLATASAQPPGPPPGDRPPPDHRDPLREALDANHDHELDADEIKNAPTAVGKLDRNGDGRVDHEEFRPPLPPRPAGGPDGFRGPPPGERGPQAGPPREGRRPGAAGERQRPGPERFLERVMKFDADADGKLDKAELEKFAGEMAGRVREGAREGSREAGREANREAGRRGTPDGERPPREPARED